MDHYFGWHDMLEGCGVRFAKMKLVGQAKLYWTNVESQIERLDHEPINHGDEKKEKLKEKYLPFSYKQKLVD